MKTIPRTDLKKVYDAFRKVEDLLFLTEVSTAKNISPEAQTALIQAGIALLQSLTQAFLNRKK